VNTSLKVMVVDDTALYRHILSRAVESIPGCSVIGTAANGEIALAKMERELPGLVLLDCEMPVMGGLATLVEIKRRHPGVVVVMVSGINQNAAAVALEALDHGALEFIAKPDGTSLEESQRALCDRLRHVCEVSQQVIKTLPSSPVRGGGQGNLLVRPSNGVIARQPQGATPAVHAVVIGVSTGGPNALARLIPALPPTLGVPVLIVQHMPAYFTGCLAKGLAKSAQIPVMEALHGQQILANQVYIAPGGRHMSVERAAVGATHILIDDGAPVKNCRPSVDVLFRSAARCYGPNALAVVMTGMGDDGKDGVQVLKAAGGRCLTQDRASSVIYGMPRAVEEAGLSDESVGLEQLAGRISELVASQRSAA